MSGDPRIDAYIARAQPFAQPILCHVRQRVAALVPDATEAIKWGAPAWLLDGRILLISAAFKGHAAINFWRGSELDGARGGAMGQCGRLTGLADLPADLDAMILAAAARSRAGPAPRPRPATKAETGLHPDFARALTANATAQAAFDAFPPGQRREYADWINAAKRDDTRVRRIAEAVAWIAQGKRRNWKYERG